MRYAEPPIVEALCEFVFVPKAPWNIQVFDDFGRALGERFPVRDQVEMMTLDIRQTETEVEHLMRPEPRARFFNADRTRLAQVGTNLMSANVLPPYPHWEPFRAFILESLAAYVGAATPEKIERMTLRYIDRIVPPATAQFRLGDWLDTTSDYVPRFLADSDSNAMSRAQKDDGVGQAVVTVMHQPDEAGASFIIMDTELQVRDVAADAVVVGAHLDQLHARMTSIFEACITDATRQILKPEAV